MRLVSYPRQVRVAARITRRTPASLDHEKVFALASSTSGSSRMLVPVPYDHCRDATRAELFRLTTTRTLFALAIAILFFAVTRATCPASLATCSAALVRPAMMSASSSAMLGKIGGPGGSHARAAQRRNFVASVKLGGPDPGELGG
jgi:hypothetical protein